MKTAEARAKMKSRAAEALKAVLSEVSTLKLKEIRCESAASISETGFLVCVDVLGHSHTLACEVKANVNPRNLRAALRELHECAAHISSDATPVLIAPYLSPQAQAMCKECSAAYLDLEGNVRLALGEIFIGKRTFAHPNCENPFSVASQAGHALHSKARKSPAAVA